MRRAGPILGLFLIFTEPSCIEQPQRVPIVNHGMVILLPGVEGSAWQFDGTIAGLRDAGLNGPIEVISWGTPPFHSLENLADYQANRARAERIAARIEKEKSQRPDGRVTLIGYSGGGGLAVMATEALSQSCRLDRLILISAAISPDYDLADVLERVSDGVVSFYSERDWFILGLGTQVFGTIDRKNTTSAGMAGFRTAKGGLLDDERLVQIPWTPDWLHYGHWGGHIGWLSRPWARDVLAAEILRGMPSHAEKGE